MRYTFLKKVTLAIFVGLILITSQGVSGFVVWRDNFNNEKRFLNNWEVGGTVYTAESDWNSRNWWDGEIAITEEGTLKFEGDVSTAHSDGSDHYYTFVEHKSGINFGSWSIKFKAHSNFPFYIIFLSTTSLVDLQGSGEFSLPAMEEESFAFLRIYNGFVSEGIQFVSLSEDQWYNGPIVSVGDFGDGWHDLVITRNRDNQFTAQIDNLNKLTDSFDFPETGSSFLIIEAPAGMVFDDLAVNNSPGGGLGTWFYVPFLAFLVMIPIALYVPKWRAGRAIPG